MNVHTFVLLNLNKKTDSNQVTCMQLEEAHLCSVLPFNWLPSVHVTLLMKNKL